MFAKVDKGLSTDGLFPRGSQHPRFERISAEIGGPERRQRPRSEEKRNFSSKRVRNNVGIYA